MARCSLALGLGLRCWLGSNQRLGQGRRLDPDGTQDLAGAALERTAHEILLAAEFNDHGPQLRQIADDFVPLDQQIRLGEFALEQGGQVPSGGFHSGDAVAKVFIPSVNVGIETVTWIAGTTVAGAKIPSGLYELKIDNLSPAGDPDAIFNLTATLETTSGKVTVLVDEAGQMLQPGAGTTRDLVVP